MAVVYPLANGNWSTITWYSGGVAYGQPPLATDDVYADGKTVTIDQNITVANIYTTQRVGGTLGGTFNVSSGSYNINANLNSGGNAPIVYTSTGNLTVTGNLNMIGNSTVLYNNGTGTVTIIGNITNTTGYSYAVNNFNTNAILVITGNITLSGNGANNIAGVYNIGVNAKVTLTGNISITSADYTGGILNYSNNALAVTVNGIVNGGYGSGASQSAIWNTSASGTVILNGIASALNGGGVRNASTGTITINGNQTVIGTAGVYAITNVSVGIININGDILGSLSATPSTAYMVANVGSGIVNINGSVIARSVSPTTGTTIGIVNNISTGTINVVGNVSGGSVANTIAINNAALGTINVTGNVTGGSNATNTPALYTQTAGTFNITGITASDVYPAIFSTVTTAKFNLLGNIVNTAGLVAYYGSLNVKCSPTAGQSITYRSTSGTDRILATTNVSNGAPTIANVRNGIVYGSTNELTGTLKMALPVDVRVNVPTDNTVGTATITAQDFWDYAVSNLTTNNSIGKRLKNVATVNTTGAQLSAFSS